jgi:hypothetical protein
MSSSKNTWIWALVCARPEKEQGFQPRIGSDKRSVQFIIDKHCVIKRNLILFDLQLDAQNSYLFIYNTFIKILFMLKALPTHLQEVYVVILYMRSLVSSLSACDCRTGQVLLTCRVFFSSIVKSKTRTYTLPLIQHPTIYFNPKFHKSCALSSTII